MRLQSDRSALALSVAPAGITLYTIGTIKGQRAHRATPGMRGFMSVGLVFDVLATLQMIRLAGTLVPGFHGVLGYSSLTLMAIEVVLIWRHWRAQGGAEIPRGQLSLPTRRSRSSRWPPASRRTKRRAPQWNRA